MTVWRRDVFCGKVPFDENTERQLRSLYGLWVAYCDMFEEYANFLDRHGSKLGRHLDMISRNKREAGQLLRTWSPPVRSSAPSFVGTTLSAESTARLREMFPAAL